MQKIITSLVIFLVGIPDVFSQGCWFQIKDLQSPQALFLKPNFAREPNDVFYLPTSGMMILVTNQAIHVECPGGYIKVNDVKTANQSARIFCDIGSVFKLDNKNVDINKISCTRRQSTARYTGQSCLYNYREAEIGFLLQDGRFLRHITVCFDEETKNTMYTVFSLTPKISQYQVDNSRLDFADAGFYIFNTVTTIAKLYTRATQRATINRQIGLPANSSHYIHQTDDYYLVRGHLTARTDFVYGSQQRVTFYHINAAPQWQTFNNGNWLALEKSVRRFSTARNLDLQVYTGTYGIARHVHARTHQHVNLYLYQQNNDKSVPVPQLFWKVVYDPISTQAVAFVGINNPYGYDPVADIICTDICNQINWIRWNPQDLKAGISYCCSLSDFNNTAKTLPYFPVSGILA